MNNQREYTCPICGADSLSTDFTDGFKWGRAYCNSCDCGGPEVRTGYDENLDAPWREEARKQFVEVVNEHVAKRSPWVKTSDRVPTEDGLGENDVVLCHQISKLYTGATLVTVRAAVEQPKKFPYWMPLPKLPEVEE